MKSPNVCAEPEAGSLQEAGTRQQILEAAARLFRRDGYAATSLRDIADACQIRAASLYHHFASKEDIVVQVLNLGVQRVHDAVRAAVEATPPGALLQATLGAAVQAHLLALLASHDFTSANIRILGQVPAGARQAHRPVRRAYEDYWRSLLQRWQQQGLLSVQRDVQLMEFFMLGAMNWSTEWFDPAQHGSPEQMAQELTAMLVHGVKGGAE